MISEAELQARGQDQVDEIVKAWQEQKQVEVFAKNLGSVYVWCIVTGVTTTGLGGGKTVTSLTVREKTSTHEFFVPLRDVADWRFLGGWK